MRIGDLDAFKKCWNENSSIGKAMKLAVDGFPSIDLETLPIVQQLRADLEKMKVERDAAIRDMHKTILECGACTACKHQFKECIRTNWCDVDGEDHWEWKGV